MPTRRSRTLAQSYRRFGEVHAAGVSPLYERVAAALSESGAALRIIEAMPSRARRPGVVLAALHDLVLAGHAPELAAAYAAADNEAAAGAAIDALLRMPDAVVAAALRRPLRPDETGRYAVLYPAIAEAARRLRATQVGLIDVGRSAALNLQVDRVGIAYGAPRTPRLEPHLSAAAASIGAAGADKWGLTLGAPTSPVHVSASVVGDSPIPNRALPAIVARIGVDLDPLDVTEEDDARWLRACLPPDQPERLARLDAELALAAAAPPDLQRGHAVEVLPDAIARVPADVLPVVLTTWALSHLTLQGRQGFVDRLDQAAAGRVVAWVSAEGVGVAPTVPTLGDRRASGHSIIGLAVFDRSGQHAEALGRCWSKGRELSWLADSQG